MGLTASQLASQIGAELRGDASRVLTACAPIDEATGEQVTFLSNPKYAKSLATTKAGAVVVSAGDAANAPAELTLLVAKDPYFAFRQAVVALHGFRRHPSPVGAATASSAAAKSPLAACAAPATGVSSLAVVDPTAKIGRDVSIHPFAVIAPHAVIGDRTVIYPHCYIGEHASIGEDCQLFPSVTVYDHCVLGNRVTLHAGCVIGQDGFGYATAKLPGEEPRHHKIPQVGNAVIEDDVEMGAGCTVDRATIGSTRIGKGTKFSDLIAIGHGASIGKHNLFVALVGIAGSTETGDYVVMGGQVGVAGHLTIGAGAQLAAQSGVMTDVPAGEKYGGQPAMPLNIAKRNYLSLTRLGDMMKEFRELQKRVAELEKK